MLFLSAASYSQPYDWQPIPEKAALMVFSAHPDDEGSSFGGALCHYTVCRQLPVILVAVTSGDYYGPDAGLIREDELRCAVWNYGMRHEPIFTRFADCCYLDGGNLESNWIAWGGQDYTVGVFTELIRRYRPDVVMCHDLLNGEYGHPNHKASGIAAAEAYFAAADPTRYPDQLATLDTWQAKKCYVHLHPTNSGRHWWNIPCDELGGQTPQYWTTEGLHCHVSQGGQGFSAPASSDFGLYDTQVGLDTIPNDYMQNIDLSYYFYKPNEPENLNANHIDPGTIELSWNDMSDDEDGFVVQRRPYLGQNGSWYDVVTLPPDTEGYIDTNGIHGAVLYRYRVGAFIE